MTEGVTIRPMRLDDVEAVSRMIVRTVRETNAKDYPPKFIAVMIARNTPTKVAARLTESQVVVATLGGEIVGTARLGREHINTVFVSPDGQRRGIGAALVGAVEDLAREARRRVAHLNATLTAEHFYRRLGYVGHVDPELARRIGLIPMRKALGPVEVTDDRAAVTIRLMTADDAQATSRMIVRAVRETNARDYPPESIEVTAASFTPEKLVGYLDQRQAVVACRDGEIVGTAALGPERIHAVFVSPDRHGAGIGAALMAVVEALGRVAGWQIAHLHASFTAVGFYERLGYEARPDPEMAERHGIVPMRKRLR